MKKLSRETDRVFVEVHQNGELLSKTSRFYHQRGVIYLTANPDGELSAPFYPLPSDIALLTITDRGVELDLDPQWSGFTTCDGKIENVSSDRKSAYTHIMKRGDFGSISYNDLRILIRIGREHKAHKAPTRHSGEYRGSVVDFWWGREFAGLWAGLAAGTFLMGGFVYGLKMRPDDRPKSFIELPDEYTLPFIHPLHLSQGPENLQDGYDRKHMIISAVRFTEDFVNVALDMNPEPKDLNSPVLNSAAEIYRQRKLDSLENAKFAQETQRDREAKQLSDPRNGMLLIPVVQGETLNSKLLRTKRSLERWYESTAFVLKMRSDTTAEFAQDPGYDFKEYKKVEKASGKALLPFKFSHDEEAMYGDAQKLADRAERERNKLTKLRSSFSPLVPEKSRPITLAAGSDYTPSISGRQFNEINRKIDSIIASLFDPTKPKKIKEPIIGSVDPRLIQQTVERSRFELQLCYELALRRNQDAQGLMEWKWHLDTQGRVSELELVESNIDDRKMISCIREKLSRWNWPKPQKGSIQISFPFYFKPSKG
ncbi:MAG: AgmX/PglI C-terminal domain-containing protein [Oligoflexus sp.]|nr:AgmX/PglI C-terminal domain-containing protein [Oligoflexus sp.]